MTNLLHNLYLFEGLGDSNLALIEKISELKSYDAGEEIFCQGAIAHSFYVIQYGRVRIDLVEEDDTHIEIATYGTGSHFGELALLDNEPRSANATAVTQSDIIRIPYASMIDLLEGNSHIAIHFYRELSRFLCSRLRLTTLDLSYARMENVSHF
jgi:CRP-like cAMP-binding protein